MVIMGKGVDSPSERESSSLKIRSRSYQTRPHRDEIVGMGSGAPTGSDEVIIVEEDERVWDGQREAVHAMVETVEIVLGERLCFDHVVVAGEDPQIP